MKGLYYLRTEASSRAENVSEKVERVALQSDTSTIVYTKPNCPFCQLAKEELKLRGIPYDEINLIVWYTTKFQFFFCKLTERTIRFCINNCTCITLQCDSFYLFRNIFCTRRGFSSQIVKTLQPVTPCTKMNFIYI